MLGGRGLGKGRGKKNNSGHEVKQWGIIFYLFISSPQTSPAYIGEYCSSGPKLEDLYNELDQLELNPPTGASDELPAALKEEEAVHIFENYSFDHTYSTDLPITSYRQQIVDTIESNSVTVIQGRVEKAYNMRHM